MTIVTSSRKPAPEVRKLAKEIAFALGFPFVQRGKAGIHDIGGEDPRVIFLSGSKRQGPVFDLMINDSLVFSMLITNVAESERTGLFTKGFMTREKELFDYLSPHVPITYDENAGGPIVFCGTQKRQYVLQVMV
jgi:U3 small nucleolar ribonucleoprotein protein IMP4